MALGGNSVAGERIGVSQTIRRSDAARGGIVDLIRVDRTAQSVRAQRRRRNSVLRAQSASPVRRDRREVAVAKRGGWDRIDEVVLRAFQVLLIGEEEEGLVLPVIEFGDDDRTAQGAAKIVAAVAGAVLSAGAVAGERIASVQSLR